MYHARHVPARHAPLTWSLYHPAVTMSHVGRWFPPGTPVSSTRKLISSSSLHRLDMTLADPDQTKPNHVPCLSHHVSLPVNTTSTTVYVREINRCNIFRHRACDGNNTPSCELCNTVCLHAMRAGQCWIIPPSYSPLSSCQGRSPATKWPSGATKGRLFRIRPTLQISYP